MLVMMLDGELSVRELGQIDKPLWQKKYDVARDPAILAAGEELVAVSPNNNDGPVELLTLRGGRLVAQLQTEAVEGMPGVPFDACFDGDGVYVLCSAGMSGRRKALFGRQSNCRGINLQRFSAKDGRRLWSRDLESTAQFYPNVLPLTVGREHVVVTARHYQIGLPYYAYIVNRDNGGVVQKLALQGKGAGAQETRRRQAVGPAVMTNRRLVVEGSEGVTIYGER